jgi:hypothetical protein
MCPCAERTYRANDSREYGSYPFACERIAQHSEVSALVYLLRSRLALPSIQQVLRSHDNAWAFAIDANPNVVALILLQPLLNAADTSQNRLINGIIRFNP